MVLYNRSEDLNTYCYIRSVSSTMTASILTVTAIAVDRYLAIRLKIQYRSVVTVSRVFKAHSGGDMGAFLSGNVTSFSHSNDTIVMNQPISVCIQVNSVDEAILTDEERTSLLVTGIINSALALPTAALNTLIIVSILTTPALVTPSYLLLTVTMIAVDRYLAIRLKIQYRSVVTVSRVKRILVAIWGLSFLVTSLPFYVPQVPKQKMLRTNENVA
ncbi:hypothetical protein QZH41_002403 [Actinostola sp. cb2023]|nr:hypothetical protein QZH41_002403 [Actinostola sp. cb2023]